MSITEKDLRELQIAYSQGNPLIPDADYDALLEEYLEEHGEDKRPFLRQQQTSAVNDVVGTLTKVYGVTKPMREGQKIYTDWLRAKKLTTEKVVVQYKFDGCSVAYDVKEERFFTRGDYDNGESVDVTDLFEKHWIEIPEGMDIEQFEAIKFEAIMSIEAYKELGLNKRYLRPRDAVSATITSRNKELSNYITLVPLRYYLNNSMQKVSCSAEAHIVHCDDIETIQSFINDVLSQGAKTPVSFMYHDTVETFEIDGVVVSVIDEDGYVDQTKEVAIKILNNIQETKLLDVKFQFGKTGRITPVAILEPVMFDRITVDHVGLSTFDRVVELGLRHGDTVRVTHNIVPYLLDTKGDGDYPIQIPTKCPICGHQFDMKTLKTVRCTNTECPGLKHGLIVRYCKNMKMMGISDRTISSLFDAGLISSIPDLYKLTVKDIMSIPGFGEVSAKNIVDTIKRSSTNVPVTRWLGALPIKDVNKKTWDTLIESLRYDPSTGTVIECNALIRNLISDQATPDRFVDTVLCVGRNIGIATIRSIKTGMFTYWDDIRNSCQFVTFAEPTQSVRGHRGDVAMTGTRDEQLTKWLTDNGYNVTSFNNNIVALIVPSHEFYSNKVVKAKEKQIPIYTIEEAYHKLWTQEKR